MATVKLYAEDVHIARSLIKRDGQVTRNFFYKQCYPLFKSIYDNYYTDCTCCKEFIDEIYLILLTPSKITGKCQMENFRGESTLTTWIKTACLFYCYNNYKQKVRMPIYEPLMVSQENNEDESDRFESIFGSVEIDSKSLNYDDVITILNKMPNKRYSNLIKLRYLEQKTNEETASDLGMSMENYYNKHKLAKAQYMRVLKEEDYGKYK